MLNDCFVECWFLHFGKKCFSIFGKLGEIVLGVLDTNFDKNCFYHINLIQESSFVQQAGLQLQHLKYIKLFKNLMEIRF